MYIVGGFGEWFFRDPKSHFQASGIFWDFSQTLGLENLGSLVRVSAFRIFEEWALPGFLFDIFSFSGFPSIFNLMGFFWIFFSRLFKKKWDCFFSWDRKYQWKAITDIDSQIKMQQNQLLCVKIKELNVNGFIFSWFLAFLVLLWTWSRSARAETAGDLAAAALPITNKNI